LSREGRGAARAAREPDLAGRVALVTGAASGIGAATARLLAAHGAVVYAADLEHARASPAVATCIAVPLDVRQERDWERVVEAIVLERGRLDVLVHSAGISRASPLADTTLMEWREVLETNLDGSFLAVKHGIRAMRTFGGSIVLLGSASGVRPPPGAAAYATSKAAVGMLARAAAKECRAHGTPVRINALNPGGVKTPMWETMPFFQEMVRERGSTEAAFDALEAEGGSRFAEPEDVAQAVLFLASDASRHVTGVELSVDDGETL
jgi:NAD(P)-dependent dehydrogenase (short-subunit alcohol dehydrogenase family)